MTLPCDLTVFERVNVDRCALRFGLKALSAEQFEFIRNVGSVDVQAAPGSGKTTLTALKLCLLASGWTDPKGGICVLSHTNTAKNQIINLVSRDPAGQRLTQYPHFIGTIQSFVDQFFALPYLRSVGQDVSITDDDAYAQSALWSLQRNLQFVSLRDYLGRRRNGDKVAGTARYRFHQSELVIEPAEGSLDCGPHTASAQQYKKLKELVTSRGIFRFDDMYAFALRYLSMSESLQLAIARRFPMVLIDEMQDTSPFQEKVLKQIFPDSSCTIQRVGDVNQRIFDRESNPEEISSFPQSNALELKASMRFGPNVARIASALTILRPQQIATPDGREDSTLFLILYDAKTVEMVISKFAEIVGNHVPPEECVKYPPRALGSRRESESSNPFPGGITTYRPGFSSSKIRAERADWFIQIVAQAQAVQAADGNTHRAAPLLWEGVASLLRRWRITLDDGRAFTIPRLKYYLERASSIERLSVKRAIVKLLSCNLTDKGTWSLACSDLIKSLRPLASGKSLTEVASNYLGFKTHITSGTVSVNQESKPNDGISDPIVICDTIHNAKGETHSATLILECPDRGVFDLREAIPMILGKADPKRVQQKIVRDCAQRIFVAATRPRQLLAVAMLGEHAQPFIHDLKESGWNLIDLTESRQSTRT